MMKKDEPMTFSKVSMSLLYLLYFVGAIAGLILVTTSAIQDIKLGLQIDTAMFIAYATYLGAPTATAIAFYAWKSKAENVIKITQGLYNLDEKQVDRFKEIAGT